MLRLRSQVLGWGCSFQEWEPVVLVCLYPPSERHSHQLQQVSLGWFCPDHGMRRRSKAGNQQGRKARTLGGEGCSCGITKAHSGDHVRATSVKHGLVLADLTLGPGNGLGDLLNLLLLFHWKQKQNPPQYIVSLWIFSPSSPHCPSMPCSKIFMYTDVLSEVYCYSLHKKFMIYVKLTGPWACAVVKLPPSAQEKSTPGLAGKSMIWVFILLAVC